MKSLIPRSIEWTFFKKVTIITNLILICSILPQHAKAAKSVKEVNKHILTCNETETGSDVKLKVETISTRISFKEGGHITYPTKRIISLSIYNKTARSVILSPEITNNISVEEASNFPFLNDTYIGTDGSEYRLQHPLFDKDKHQYPAELLRLKATIPVTETSKQDGAVTTHYYINLVLPESRLQNGVYKASGYVGYSIKSIQLKQTHDSIIGLTLLNCTEKNESLEEAQCLSKEEEQKISEIEKEIAEAKIQNPGCEKSYGAAACISPIKQAMFRYLKSKTVKCQ
jgi:hypothetical protein